MACVDDVSRQNKKLPLYGSANHRYVWTFHTHLINISTTCFMLKRQFSANQVDFVPKLQQCLHNIKMKNEHKVFTIHVWQRRTLSTGFFFWLLYKKRRSTLNLIRVHFALKKHLFSVIKTTECFHMHLIFKSSIFSSSLP